MSYRISRRDVLRGFTGAVGLAVVGCTPSPTAPTSSTTSTGGSAAATQGPPVPKRGGLLTLAGQVATNLDPNRITGAADLYYSSLCYNQLVRWDRDPEKGFNPQPELAQSWEVAPDLMSVVFKIRPGVKFANLPPVNGREFTAEDAKWNIDRLGADQPYFVRRAYWSGAVQSTQVVDKYTLKINLKQPTPDLLIQLGNRWTKMLAREAVEAAGDDAFNTDGKWHIGTGPFILQEYRRDVGSKWTRNPEYWKQGQPYVDNITVRWFPDPTAKFAAVRAGETADMGFFTTATEFRILQALPGLVTAQRPGISWTGIMFNLKAKPFDDARVRNAVAHALDVDSIVKGAYQGGYLASRTAVPVSFKEESLPAAEWPKYDVAKSKQLLADAGLANGFKFTLLTGNSQEETKLVATLVKEQLAKVNIDMTIEMQDTQNITRRSGLKDFEATYLGSWAGDVVLSGFLGVYYHSKATARNYMGYSNPAYDRVVDDLGRTADPAKRKDLSLQAQRILLEDMPVVHVGVPVDFYAWQSWFKGFSPSWHPGYMVSFTDEFWIDK